MSVHVCVRVRLCAGDGWCVPNEPKSYTELFDLCWSGGASAFKGNVLVGSPAYPKTVNPSLWPAGNFFTANRSEVGFANQSTYALSASSPFKGKGTDGRDPGADIPTLLRAISGVRGAGRAHG